MSNILLDEKDFKDLVSGKIVKQAENQIALMDIGFSQMINIINNFIIKQEKKNEKIS